VVSVVDTTANTVKVRFDLQFDEKVWEHAEITAAHSQPPELPTFHMGGKLYVLACIFVMPYVPVKIHTIYITP